MERLHLDHLGVVLWIAAVRHAEESRKRKERGYEAQQERREMERKVRIRAVELTPRADRCGYARIDVARRLGISPRTLSEWRRRYEEDRLAVRPRGRPAGQVDRELARRITEALHLLGPFEGLTVLMSLFPDVPRAELEARLRRYRDEYVGQNHVVVQALRWQRAGAVWAMDFTEPPLPVDGIYRYILSVRDLGSGKSLLWLPLVRCTGLAVRDALVSLFLEHGVPLVIKADNDRAFKIEELRELLAACRIVFLFSPTYTPEYNGACEAGIGTLKTYAHHEAARHDRPGEWTCDDVEAARLRANELTRPRGLDGPTPDQMWNEREKVSPDERRAFHVKLDRRREQYLEEARKEKEDELNEVDRAAIERRAIAATLIACGFLLVRRRRISPPIKSKLWARIK